jgi:hypothetical protein
MAITLLKPRRASSRLKLAAGMVLTLACAAPVSRAAVTVPESAVGPDTFMVAHVNMTKVDPAQIDASIKAVMGPAAPAVNKGMDEYKDKFKEMTDAGVESLTIVASGDPDKEPVGVGYAKLKSGADHAAAEAKFKEEQAKEAAKHPDAKPDEADVTWEGDYMVIHKKGEALPKGGDSARAKQFAEAFSATDKALDIVFVPTDKIRTQMKEQAKQAAGGPPWATAAAEAASDAKSASIGITLGETPSLDVMINAADEAGAKKLVDATNEAANMLKAQAAQFKQAGPQLAPMADAMNAIAGSLQPKQDGAKVTMAIDAKTVGPAVSQLIQTYFAGAGAGGGAPPAKGGSGL